MRNYLSAIYILLVVIITVGCKKEKGEIYSTDTLKIKKLTENTYIHISYLPTEKWGKVTCNGMVVIDNNEAIVVDTPVDNEVSKELINWIEQETKSTIKAVVPTHFHEDCLGGITTFHEKKISSYAGKKTIDLLKEQQPTHQFGNYIELPVGKNKITCEFLGEGHTKDNIVVYYATDKVLFGGCLVKALQANKGNLADANTNEWSSTVAKVKEKYNEAVWVIPGHGNEGSTDLLTYTIQLFKQ